MAAMSPRERWLAAMRMQPVDRLPFWPKLSGSYAPAQQPPFDTMDNAEIHRWIGSDQHNGISGCVRNQRTKTAGRDEGDDKTQTTSFETPHGTLTRVSKFDPHSQSWHPVKMPVTCREDIKIMRTFVEDTSPCLDPEGLAKANVDKARIGETSVTSNGVGESPLMEWVEWLAGVENAHFFLLDYQDEVEALFEAMQEVLIKRWQIVAEHSVADLIYMIENTSTTLISPTQYRQYCLPHMQAYAKIANAYDRNLVLHMCGTLKDVLPELATLPVRAFEAFTSAPVGNTSLSEGRAACPDTCLVGGTNATLWLASADQIIAEIEADLGRLPHHRGIVVTSAGVMPPLARPETIKAVCDWVKQFPVKT